MRSTAADSPMRKLSLDELMPDETELGQLLLDAGKSPEGKLLRREERHLLHQALLHIPTPLRLVLVLHDMEELDTELVAQILDLRAGTVRVRLHRARLALRKETALILKGAPPVAPALQRRKAPPRNARQVVRRPKECRELFAGLSEYIDGRVEAEACERMSAHIQGCPACVVFLRNLRAAIDRCRSMEVACDPAVTARLQAMLTREYLRLIGKAAPIGDGSEA